MLSVTSTYAKCILNSENFIQNDVRRVCWTTDPVFTPPPPGYRHFSIISVSRRRRVRCGRWKMNFFIVRFGVSTRYFPGTDACVGCPKTGRSLQQGSIYFGGNDWFVPHEMIDVVCTKAIQNFSTSFLPRHPTPKQLNNLTGFVRTRMCV